MGLDNPTHIIALVAVLLLVFGAKRLPEIGRSLGTGLREFKGGITGETNAAGGVLQTPVAATATATDVPAAQPQWQPASAAVQTAAAASGVDAAAGSAPAPQPTAAP
jgi:sec-independent protein translocase protein TatA